VTTPPAVRRVRSGAVAIEVFEWGASEKGHATAVIAMHGAVGSAASWDDEGAIAQAGGLGGRARTFASLSRRGCGGSDTPERGYALADFADDVAAVAGALGYRSFVLAGHSLGVPIVLTAAAKRLPGLAGVVLLDYGPRYPGYTDEWVAQLAERERAGRLGVVRLPAMRALRAESREAQLDELLPAIEVPVLVLAGTVDSGVTSDDRARFARGLRDVRVVTIAGADHNLSVGGDPGSFHTALGRFLAELDGVPSKTP
jgi:pimeloyl-ACP methyl ester carboxylesterase